MDIPLDSNTSFKFNVTADSESKMMLLHDKQKSDGMRVFDMKDAAPKTKREIAISTMLKTIVNHDFDLDNPVIDVVYNDLFYAEIIELLLIIIRNTSRDPEIRTRTDQELIDGIMAFIEDHVKPVLGGYDEMRFAVDENYMKARLQEYGKKEET